MIHDNRIDLETAQLLDKTSFSFEDMESWNNHVYTKRLTVRDDIMLKYGYLSDDGYYELTKQGGGYLDWYDVYSNDWRITPNFYPLADNECFLFCPTIYEVQAYLRNYHKKQITVYSKSQESWQYRITKPNENLEDGLFGEDFESYEDALKDAIKITLKLIQQENDKCN